MSKQKNTKGKIGNVRFRFRANGKSQTEKWYALARRFAAIIARRTGMKRCKRCFAMTMRDGKQMPRFGCDGCTEVETFAQECKAFFGVGDRKPDGCRKMARG